MVELQERLRSVEHELVVAYQKRERLYRALEDGELTNADLAPRIRERNTQIQTLETTQRELQAALAHPLSYIMSLAEIRAYLIECRQTLAEASVAERKALLRSFVQCITIEQNEGGGWRGTLKYAFPAPVETSAGNRVLGFDRVSRPKAAKPRAFYRLFRRARFARTRLPKSVTSGVMTPSVVIW